MFFKKNLLGIYKMNNQKILKLAKILMKNDVVFEMENSCSEIVMKFFKVVIEKNFGRRKMGYFKKFFV